MPKTHSDMQPAEAIQKKVKARSFADVNPSGFIASTENRVEWKLILTLGARWPAVCAPFPPLLAGHTCGHTRAVTRACCPMLGVQLIQGKVRKRGDISQI